MGVYSSGTTQTRTNNKWAGYAFPANPGYVRFLRHHIYIEGGGVATTVQRWGWQRITGATLTAATAEKASTRSPAFAGTAATLESVGGTLSGNPYYFFGTGQEQFLTMRHLAYPRPQANPALYDAEQGAVVANVTAGASNVYDTDTVFSDDVPRVPSDHLPRRRSRKSGWYHAYRHGTERNGVGGQIINNCRAQLVWQVGRNRNVGWATRGFNLLHPAGGTTFPISVTAGTVAVNVTAVQILDKIGVTSSTVSTPATVARKALLNIVSGTVTLPVTVVRKALLAVKTGNVSLTASDQRKGLLTVTSGSVSTPASVARKALLGISAGAVSLTVTVATKAVKLVTIVASTVSLTATVQRLGKIAAVASVSTTVTAALQKIVSPVVQVTSWAVQNMSTWGSAWSLLRPPPDDDPVQDIHVPEQPDEPLR